MLKDFYHLQRDNNPHRKSAFTLSCLGKLYPASSKELRRCSSYLADLIARTAVNESYTGRQSRIEKKNGTVLVIGLTESGIIPALLMYLEAMALDLDVNILFSTRREASGLSFKEIHSHGPDHILPIPGGRIDEIWIVEDEITSGNTVFNLMLRLSEYIGVDRLRIFAFADFRDSAKKRAFAEDAEHNNIICSVHTLYSQTDEMEMCGSLNRAEAVTAKSDNGENRCRFREKLHLSERSSFRGWHLPMIRPALSMRSGSLLEPERWTLPEDLSMGTVLTVGEAIDLAALFSLFNDNIRFQQITLSPWIVDNSSIFSRIRFGEKHFLYNFERLKSAEFHPLFILCDPVDRAVELEAIDTLGKSGIHVHPFPWNRLEKRDQMIKGETEKSAGKSVANLNLLI